MKIINRAEITDKYAREILDVETHHDHIICKDENGPLRWKPNMKVREYIDEHGLNKVIQLLELLGCNRNSEIVRKLYRDIGYSLVGYWEVFYWEVNNDLAQEYRPPHLKQFSSSPWRSFPDEKPEPYVWTLVTGQNSSHIWVELARFDGEFFELPAKVQGEVVTHWMPLPSPAKKPTHEHK